MRNDSLAKLFLVLVCCIWVPVLIFSFPYIRHAGGERSFMTVYTMTLGVLAGLAMAANFVTMYMFFEMMSLITVPMVLHNGTSAARSSGFAGWKSSDPIAASFAAIIPRSEAKRNGMSMFFEFKG